MTAKLTNWIRRSLAEWLWPEPFKKQRQYEWEFARMADAYWWLGEFPEACATLRWVLDNHQDWRLKANEPARKRVHYWCQDIGQFREQLRSGEHIKVFGPSKEPPHEAP